MRMISGSARASGMITTMALWAVILSSAPGQAHAQVSLAGRPLIVDSGTIKSRQPGFAQSQQKNGRVLDARLEKRFELKKMFRDRGLDYPAAEVFVRIFKRERQLELWARPRGRDTFTMVKSYAICALSGKLGPKREQGDEQTPEGFYHIDGFNPVSDFHLSLHLDYPNRSDIVLSGSASPGSNIFIHGGCRTVGCLAVTDDAIKELYWLAVEAQSMGQRRIPVHIFPTRLNDRELRRLMVVFDKQPELKRFWANLKPAYEYFEVKHKLPLVSIDDRGRYIIQPQLGVPLSVTEARRASTVPVMLADRAHKNAPMLQVVRDSAKPILKKTTSRRSALR